MHIGMSDTAEQSLAFSNIEAYCHRRWGKCVRQKTKVEVCLQKAREALRVKIRQKRTLLEASVESPLRRLLLKVWASAPAKCC